jgi:cobaltochelatase CobN
MNSVDAAKPLKRNIVVRADGRRINAVRTRGNLFICSNGCCCGREVDGFAPIPVDLYHNEWERRGLRNSIHQTIGG